MWEENTDPVDDTASEEEVSTGQGYWNNGYSFKFDPGNINYSTMSPLDGAWEINATVYYPDNTHLFKVVNASRIVVNCLGIASIILNVFFLVAVQVSKERHSPFHRFMKSLSIADIMAALTFMMTQNWPEGLFSYIYPSDHFLLRRLLPYIFRGMPWMFFTCYFLTLTCLSINQYVAVCKPWKYSMISSQKWVTYILCFVWLLSSLQIIMPTVVLIALACTTDSSVAVSRLYTISKVEMQIWMGIFLACTFVSIALNFMIYRKIRELKWKRQMSVTSQETLNIRMKQEAFITITLLLVTAMFLRFPFPIVSIVILELDSRFIDIGQTESIIINAVVLFLLFINFFTDPIIYTMRMKEARQLYQVCLCTSSCSDTSRTHRSRPMKLQDRQKAFCCGSSRSFDGRDPRVSLNGERTEITMALVENGRKQSHESINNMNKDSEES